MQGKKALFAGGAIGLALLLAPAPAGAQRHGGGGRMGGGFSGGGRMGGGFRGGGGMMGGGFRGGGGHMGGGFRGGGGYMGGGFRGGSMGGYRGGYGGGFRGGYYGGGYRGGYYGGYRGGYFGRSFGHFYRPYYYGYPGLAFSLGFGYWPSYYDWGYWPPAYYPPSYYSYPPSYSYYAPSDSYYDPPVVVERDTVRYRDREAAPDEERGPVRRVGTAAADRYWLLAFQDKNIQAVTDYWLEGSILHYVSRQGSGSSAELSSIDVPFTKELNRERGVEFRLPRSNGGGGGGERQPVRRDSFGRPY